MKKKLFFLMVVLVLVFSLSIGATSTAYASEVGEVYTYQDESVNSIFVLKDQTSYECSSTNLESGDTVDITGTYIRQGNRITFYLDGEVLVDGEIGENGVITAVDLDETNETYLPESELNEINDIEDYTAQIVEYIIAGVLGLLGTSAVAIAFRKHLKNLIKSVTTALGLLKTNKDTAEEDIKKIMDEADNTLASLKNVKEEMLEINRKEFEAMKRQISLLYKTIIYMTGGMKELVINGTAETVCNLLQKPNKDVNENANEEIQ